MPSPPHQLGSTGGPSQMGGLSTPVVSLPAAVAGKQVGRSSGAALTMCMPAARPAHQRAVSARLTSSPRNMMTEGVVQVLPRPASPVARPASLVGSPAMQARTASPVPQDASRSARATSPVVQAASPVMQAASPLMQVSSPVAHSASPVAQSAQSGTPCSPSLLEAGTGASVAVSSSNGPSAAESTSSEAGSMMPTGSLYRVTCNFEASEGDSPQLTLVRDDLVYVQCHDPSGWSYGRLECPGEHSMGARMGLIGSVGWFPSALLTSQSPLATARTRCPDDADPEMAPEPQTTARSTTTLLLSARTGSSSARTTDMSTARTTETRSSAQSTARTTATSGQEVSSGGATPAAPVAEKERPESSRHSSRGRRKPLPSPGRGASWSPGRRHGHERQESPPSSNLRMSAEGGIWREPVREVSPARLRYERLRREGCDEQDRIQQCEKLLFETARLQRRQLGMVESAGRSTWQAEEAVEQAERLLAAMEMQEKRCRIEASCVAGSSSASLRQSVESKLRMLEVKKDAAMMNLQAAKQRLEFERHALDAVRDQMRSEREAAVMVVEGLAQHRMRVGSVMRPDRIDSYSEMVASAHPSSGSRHQSPQSTRCSSPLGVNRQPSASSTSHARAASQEEAMDSATSTLKQRPRHVLHRQGSSPRLLDETSSASSRSSTSGFKTPGVVPVGLSAAGAPPPRASPSQGSGRVSKKHRAQSSSPIIVRGRKGQHTRSSLARAPSRETLTTVVHNVGRSQSPSDRNSCASSLHFDMADGPRFHSVVQNGGKAYAQAPGLPAGATEEELTHMLDVLRTAEALQAKLAAMPDHLRLPLARWLSAEESVNAESS